jgi:hypothetical protein
VLRHGAGNRKTPLLAESTLSRNGYFQFELPGADGAVNGVAFDLYLEEVLVRRCGDQRLSRDLALRAARALLYESAESVWATVAGGSPRTMGAVRPVA